MLWFDTDSVDIDAQGDAVLDWGIGWLRSVNAVRIEISGHTDRVGSDRYNLDLSRRRAEAVKAALIKRGFPAANIVVIPYGEERPLVETADEVAERQNRYVLVQILEMRPSTP
jgi:outer membrane protein OmpA-like peptidoglycan-associated protein